MRRRDEREAWTAAIEGREPKKANKYSAERKNGFASKKEARIAAELQILEKAGKIKDLKMQVPIVLVEGRDGVRGLKYVADFTYCDLAGTKHVVDAKGYRKNAVYLVKKKLAYLLKGIQIEEV
jgi:hypothetical protein